VKLYIPGRIIHLVDTTGDETKYIAYWASRYEFNQVVISNTLLSDHSMIPLPDILRDLDLENVHETDAFVIKDAKEDTEDPTFLKFILCSYPNGGVTSLLVVSSLAAFICSFLSNTVCKYVTRETLVYFPNSTKPYPGHGISVGIYSYTLKQCNRHDSSCVETRPVVLEDSKYCQTYPSALGVDSYWTAARVFSIISICLALIGLAVTSLATCAKMKKKRWKAFALLFLGASLCQGFQFLMFQSDLCNVISVPKGYESHATCSMSKGAYFSILALILHFLTALGCILMYRRKT
jgi:hypothetical protein